MTESKRLRPSCWLLSRLPRVLCARCLPIRRRRDRSSPRPRALPESLASIPVLQVQLNADGSIRSIDVLRTPRFHPHTLQLATQAIRRAAPFGPVGHLPRPWQFSETFLYNDDFKFQLRTLAETP